MFVPQKIPESVRHCCLTDKTNKNVCPTQKSKLDSGFEVLYLDFSICWLFFSIVRFGVPFHSRMKQDEKGIPCSGSVCDDPGKAEAAPQL
jgi:hypothetical protein